MLFSNKILFFIVFTLISTLSLVGQKNGSSFVDVIENYSASSGIQFAYNPEQFSDLNSNKNTSINSEAEFEAFLQRSEIEYQKINNERWLLKLAKKIETDILTGATFSGKVKEQNGEPLISALIFTEGAEFASLTDNVGEFTLDIPDANVEYKVCCQYLGYEIKCISSKEITDNQISFDLEPKFIQIDGVKIQSKRLKFSISPISDHETIIIAGSDANNAALGKDVLRTAQLFSGVDATNDMSSSLRIRASEGLQSLVTLDGIPIYNPESAFGIFSTLNPLAVTKSRLYKNALPLEYGEFTGGYLACDGLINQQKELKFDVDVSTLKSAFALQLPLSERTQISGAIRRTNGRVSNEQFYSRISKKRDQEAQIINLFNRPQSLDTDLENTFGDIYLNFLHSTKKNLSFQATLFANRDLSTSEFTNESSIERPGNGQTLTVNEALNQERTKTNSGLSFQVKKKFESNRTLSVLMYSSNYWLQDQVEASVAFSNNAMQERILNELTSTISNAIKETAIKVQFESDQNDMFNFKAGVDVRRIETGVGFVENEEDRSRAKNIPSLIPYIGFGINYQDIFKLNLGNRTSVLLDKSRMNGGGGLRVFLSPRINASLKVSDGLYLKSSFSHNEQFFRPLEIERQLGQSVAVNLLYDSNQIPILRSNQFTFGSTIKSGAISINTDLYIRENLGIVQQILSIPGINTNDANVFGNNQYEFINGHNRVVGLDITSMYEYKDFSSLVSYTLSKSQDRFKPLFDNAFIDAQNNRLHQWNIFTSYDHKKWNFNSTIIYGSGVNTLNREFLENIKRADISPENLFKQLPAYKRWDLGLSYDFSVKSGKLSLDLSLYNVLNNNNINSEVYIYSTQVGDKKGLGSAEIQLLNRTWNVGLRYSF